MTLACTALLMMGLSAEPSHKLLVTTIVQSKQVDGTVTRTPPTGPYAKKLEELVATEGWAPVDATGRFLDPDTSSQDISRVARALNAEVVVRCAVSCVRQAPGKAGIIVEVTPDGRQIVFYSVCDATFDVVDLADDSVIARFADRLQTDAGLHASKSYDVTEYDTFVRAAPAFAEKVRDALKQALRARDFVRLELSHVDYGQVADVEKALRSVKGVKSVELHGDFADQKQTFELRYDGKADALGKQLGKLKPKLVVGRVTDRVIEASLP